MVPLLGFGLYLLHEGVINLFSLISTFGLCNIHFKRKHMKYFEIYITHYPIADVVEGKKKKDQLFYFCMKDTIRTPWLIPKAVNTSTSLF